MIGAGRLGSALAAAIAQAGTPVLVATRREAPTALVALDGVTAAPAPEVVKRCDLVFLAVPDGAIESVAASLSWRTEQAIVHCSGARGLDALDAATTRGSVAGCLHPLQTFAGGLTPQEATALFQGVTCGIEGVGALGERLEVLTRALGATPVRLEGVDRARYHAAAVLASNDVVALMAAAARTWASAGLPPEAAREALAPLMQTTARNVSALPLAQALTGPIARGDIETVARHLRALEDEPALGALYRALGAELLRLDLGHSEEVAGALRGLLERP